MTDNEIIIAVAGLDGWQLVQDEEDSHLMSIYKDDKYCQTISKEMAKQWYERRFHYLTSRDAIVPVIEKVFKFIKHTADNWAFCERFSVAIGHDEDYYEGWNLCPYDLVNILIKEPKQLSIALLKAVGEWRE